MLRIFFSGRIALTIASIVDPFGVSFRWFRVHQAKQPVQKIRYRQTKTHSAIIKNEPGWAGGIHTMTHSVLWGQGGGCSYGMGMVNQAGRVMQQKLKDQEKAAKAKNEAEMEKKKEDDRQKDWIQIIWFRGSGSIITKSIDILLIIFCWNQKQIFDEFLQKFNRDSLEIHWNFDANSMQATKIQMNCIGKSMDFLIRGNIRTIPWTCRPVDPLMSSIAFSLYDLHSLHSFRS